MHSKPQGQGSKEEAPHSPEGSQEPQKQRVTNSLCPPSPQGTPQLLTDPYAWAVPRDTHVRVPEGWMDALHSCHRQRQPLQIPKLAAQVIVGTDDADHGLLACTQLLQAYREPLCSPLPLLHKHPPCLPLGLASQPGSKKPALPPQGAASDKSTQQNGEVRDGGKTRKRLSAAPQQPQAS